jgi:hypothetical protein
MGRRTNVDPVTRVDESDMKTLAMQQCLQLPTDYDEAMAVLGYMRDIVMWKAGLVGPTPIIRDEGETVVNLNQKSRQRA